MPEDLPIALEFDFQRPAGFVSLSKSIDIPNLHEYFLAPDYQKNDDGTFTLLGYGLVHRSHLPTMVYLDKKYGKGNY